MRVEDDLKRMLPQAPQERPLPQRQAHRANLLTAISSVRDAAPAFSWPALRWPTASRWLMPASAAVGVTAIVLTAIALSGAAVRQAPSPPSGGAAGVRHWWVASSGLRGVVVRANSGPVTVAGADGGPVAVTARPHFHGRAPAIYKTVSDGVLTVSALCPVTVSQRPQGQHCSVTVGISLPRGLPVRVSAHLGNVSVADMTGRVTVTDEFGNVDLSGLAGRVVVMATLGSIHGRDLACRSVMLSAQRGSIGIAFVTPPEQVVAVDQVGSVAVSVPPGTSYRVQAGSLRGKVTVTVLRSARSARLIRAFSPLGNVLVTG